MNSYQRGFSLIEVMVSLLITMVGVLGMVALQSKAIPYTQDSAQRNTAIMLADDLVEIIRSAPADCTKSNSCLKAAGSEFPAAPDSCVPTPVALSAQIGCWQARAAAALPDAGSLLTSTFYICKTATAGNVSACTTSSATNAELEILIAWKVRSAAECMAGSSSTAVGTCTYTLRTRIR